MASLLVLLIILGSIAYQFLKGSLVKAFNSFIFSVISVTIALSFFEMVSNLYITRNADIEIDMIYWSRAGAFILLFVLSYIILETAAASLLKIKIDLGLWPDRIGRCFFALFQGWIIAGAVLIFLALAPLSAKFPYERFPNQKKTENAAKVFFNADGFAAGFGSFLSSGSLGGENSFSAIHPDFINEIYLNRNLPEKIKPIDSGKAAEINNKAAVWPASDNLKLENDPNQIISPASGSRLMFVRIVFKKSEFVEFTMPQIKLVCKRADKEQPVTKGSGTAVFPIGFLYKDGIIKSPISDDKITLDKKIFTENTKGIDFLFNVPEGYVPAIIQYKLNNFFELPPPLSGDQIPPPSPLS